LYRRSAVMTAAVLVLTRIFEVDMPLEQHAYRANFSGHATVRSVHSLINTGHNKQLRHRQTKRGGNS
jgi:hypothetical protein